MSQRERSFDRRVAEYWEWFAVALFLLLTVDLLTTLGAAAEIGVAAEANPLVAWLLERGPLALAVANLLALVLAAFAFSGVIEAARLARPPYDRYLELAVEVWLGLLVAAGLFVSANNLAVVVWGASLV